MILKRPRDAFPTFAQNWDVNAATFEKLNKLLPTVEVDVKRRIEKIYKNLGAISATLASGYTANYLAFAAAPCDKDSVKRLKQQNEKLSNAVLLLIALQYETEREKTGHSKDRELQINLDDLVE